MYFLLCHFLTLPCDIHSQVVEVDYSGDRVTVVTSSGQTFSADRVIVTVPLALLKAEVIRFCPPLPERKVEAIRSLGAGIIEKVCEHLFNSIALFPTQQGAHK